MSRRSPARRPQGWTRPPGPSVGGLTRRAYWMLIAFSVCFALAYTIAGCAGQGLRLETDTTIEIPPLEPPDPVEDIE